MSFTEGVAVGVRHVHALLLELLDDGGFTVADAVAGEVLRLDGLFLQDGLQFGLEALEEHLVEEKDLAVEVVVRERELVLGFKERVGENREDGVSSPSRRPA